MDYGLKVSKAGSDVKTAADKDLLATSKNNILKISQVDLQTIPDLGNAVVTHSLGYIPFFMSFVKDGSNNWHPVTNGGIGAVSFSTAADDTVVSSRNTDGANRTVRTLVFYDQLAP